MRSSVPGPTPTAAPTRKRPSESLQAFGLLSAFWKSLTVIRPVSLKLSSTTRIFSIRCSCISSSTSSELAPSLTVTRRSLGVITLSTDKSRRFSKRMSRPVIIPIRLFSESVTGKPEYPSFLLNACTLPKVSLAPTVTGSETTPLSYFLTSRTCLACSSAVMFL